jgi:plasmid stabilization system protein ParE
VIRGFRFHPAAREELDAAGEWYDEQLRGLSLGLLDAVQEAIDLVMERPEAWQQDVVVGGHAIRRIVMKRFPFSVVYYVADDEVRIVALAHAKLRPGYWRRRVQDRF